MTASGLFLYPGPILMFHSFVAAIFSQWFVLSSKSTSVHKLNCVTAFKLCSIVTLSPFTRDCFADDGENAEKL